jgi:hypothetical protein
MKLATCNISTPQSTKLSPTTPGSTKLDEVVPSLRGKERATKLGHDIFSESMYSKLYPVSSDSLEALERMNWITPDDLKTSSSTKLGSSTTSPPPTPLDQNQPTTSSTQLSSGRILSSPHGRPTPGAQPSGTPTQLPLRPVIRSQPPGAQIVRMTPAPRPANSRFAIIAPSVA